jgi:hypothetical protein
MQKAYVRPKAVVQRDDSTERGCAAESTDFRRLPPRTAKTARAGPVPSYALQRVVETVVGIGMAVLVLVSFIPNLLRLET